MQYIDTRPLWVDAVDKIVDGWIMALILSFGRGGVPFVDSPLIKGATLTLPNLT